MNQIAPKTSFRDVAIADQGGGGKLMPQTFGDVVSFSEIMARAQHAIPKHLRDCPGACMAVTMQALRWSMDPFAVASKSYNVKDIISYEAQLIAAVVHTRAPIKNRPNYVYAGEGQDRRCTVSALFDDGIERSYESPRIGDIPTKNSPLWKADPDQQLSYYSIRSFARRYCPEVILGVYTPEEAETFRGPDNARDVTPRGSLSDRLTAGSGPEASGFSTEHVVSEIDGATDSNSSQAVPSAPPTETDTPAADDPPDLAAGTPSELLEAAEVTGNGGDRTGDDSSSAGPVSSLPPDWQDTYLLALSRATDRPKSLQNRHTEALQLINAEPISSELEWMRAAYALIQKKLRGEITKAECDKLLAEIKD